MNTWAFDSSGSMYTFVAGMPYQLWNLEDAVSGFTLMSTGAQLSGTSNITFTWNAFQ